MLKVQTFPVNGSPPSQNICKCRECNELLDSQLQADGKGGYYIIVTCFNRQCELRYVTRELEGYKRLSDEELESYREMNRARGDV